jgi:hypothetical protein
VIKRYLNLGEVALILNPSLELFLGECTSIALGLIDDLGEIPCDEGALFPTLALSEEEEEEEEDSAVGHTSLKVEGGAGLILGAAEKLGT